MENDCAFANLEDKFKEKQNVAVESILHGPLDIIFKHLLSLREFNITSCFYRHDIVLCSVNI
jgi:hypothetical protein